MHYGEISAPQRRTLHRRVAQALEAIHREGDLDSVSGQIASHYERAGMIEQALPFYQHAAAGAQRVYANEEAISLLSRGLELLELLPPGSKRDKQEPRLQLALAPLDRVTKGWGTVELEHVLDRALALCDTVGDDTQRLQTLFGLQSFRAHAEQALALASTYKAPYYRVWASSLVNYALVLEQPNEECIGDLRNSIAEFKASSARLRLPYYLSLLAQGYGKAGRTEEGLAALTRHSLKHAYTTSAGGMQSYTGDEGSSSS